MTVTLDFSILSKESLLWKIILDYQSNLRFSFKNADAADLELLNNKKKKFSFNLDFPNNSTLLSIPELKKFHGELSWSDTSPVLQ